MRFRLQQPAVCRRPARAVAVFQLRTKHRVDRNAWHHASDGSCQPQQACQHMLAISILIMAVLCTPCHQSTLNNHEMRWLHAAQCAAWRLLLLHTASSTGCAQHRELYAPKPYTMPVVIAIVQACGACGGSLPPMAWATGTEAQSTCTQGPWRHAQGLFVSAHHVLHRFCI